MDEDERRSDRIHGGALDSIGDALRAPGVTVRLVFPSADEADEAVEHIERLSLKDDINGVDAALRVVTFTNGSRIVVQVGDAS